MVVQINIDLHWNFYLMTTVTLTLKIIIGILVDLPAHGKDFVDVPNGFKKGNIEQVYQTTPPQRVKTLVCFIMPPVGRILFLRINARIF